MNCYTEDLKYSESRKFWEQAYKEAFPTMLGFHRHPDDGWHQRFGVDVTVVLKGSKTIRIDEKVRRKPYNDIGLEFASNVATGTPGWVCKDLLCDYIAYAIEPRGVVYFLPTLQLQIAWSKKGEEWKERFRVKYADNGNYQTAFVPVPVNELYSAIGSCLRCVFEAESQ